ncbi:EamA family transporter [Iodobacter ciconiae]|uniref:EamA family transporter n=1 Tax=Iodobacter ciconiae TaxID=2496266 RepID=UPI001F32E1E7|nr:EamA family transporter [Iodobacter ciconiae]
MVIPVRGIGLVLFAGVASSLIAAYCWMRGVHHLGADRTAVFMHLLPLSTALIAMFVLGEKFRAFIYWEAVWCCLALFWHKLKAGHFFYYKII